MSARWHEDIFGWKFDVSNPFPETFLNVKGSSGISRMFIVERFGGNVVHEEQWKAFRILITDRFNALVICAIVVDTLTVKSTQNSFRVISRREAFADRFACQEIIDGSVRSHSVMTVKNHRIANPQLRFFIKRNVRSRESLCNYGLLYCVVSMHVTHAIEPVRVDHWASH